MSKKILALALLVPSLILLTAPEAAFKPIFPQPLPVQTPTSVATAVAAPASNKNSLRVMPLQSVAVVTVPTAVSAPKPAIELPAPAVINYASTVDARRSGNTAITADGSSFPNYAYKALAIPNDPRANQSFVTTANLSAAWDTPRNGAPTLLAIIDTGFALQHEEFANRFYTNPGEQGAASRENPSLLNCTARSLPLNQSCNLIDDNGDGIVDNEVGTTTKQNPSRLNCSAQGRSLNKDCNLIDDDANGFIDDVRGWDFINNDSVVQAGEINPNGAGTHHGSYVTGVAAATGDNGVGLAGVDWGTKILPLQALDDEGSGDTVAVANAIDYAVARKANVISLSLGGASNDPLLLQAVRRAIKAGVIVVAAAGNDGCDCMLYPANYPEVIAVGASTSTGQPANFSSFGRNLDILAPGVNLYTTNWSPSNPTSAYASGVSGTSLATPIIAGLLTRLISQQPTASATQLVASLTENGNHLGLTAASPRSDSFGYGLVNAGASTNRINASYAPAQLYSFGQVSLGETGNALLYQCDAGVIGTTAVFELKKADSLIFSSSTLENQTLQEQGYSSSLFAHSCVSQPQDKPLMVRSLNVFSEFRNVFNK